MAVSLQPVCCKFVRGDAIDVGDKTRVKFGDGGGAGRERLAGDSV